MGTKIRIVRGLSEEPVEGAEVIAFPWLPLKAHTNKEGIVESKLPLFPPIIMVSVEKSGYEGAFEITAPVFASQSPYHDWPENIIKPWGEIVLRLKTRG